MFGRGPWIKSGDGMKGVMTVVCDLSVQLHHPVEGSLLLFSYPGVSYTPSE